jgi:hypothetical protein
MKINTQSRVLGYRRPAPRIYSCGTYRAWLEGQGLQIIQLLRGGENE